MTQIPSQKHYDLEERTFKFAQAVRIFVKEVPKSFVLSEDLKQLLRSSGSIGANYIEANESLSKKDFLMRIKICRKESKESKYWLTLLDISDTQLEKKKHELIDEVYQLMKIFGAIIEKSQ